MTRARALRGRRSEPLTPLVLMRLRQSAALNQERYEECRDEVLAAMRGPQTSPRWNPAASIVARHERNRTVRTEARALLRACGDARRVRT